ncbi:hypothetical protein AAG747_21675 [Rapidithrix thailandica]|uniref:Uncharacterized protein n=1 Tax=Rapidithrix thailandica TaxID=413964 RepID=A0AAW9SDE2_9BACT
MIQLFLKRRLVRTVALGLSLSILIQLFSVPVSYALTGGPSQPEVQAFEPVGTTEMVDLFSGDFTYNIPLFELPGPNGGYPFNLAYHAGVGMDQEASWVGLGWSLNPGAINRQVRGLPDEFKGDKIVTKTHIKPNVTIGGELGVGGEIFGNSKIKGEIGLKIFNNSYKGVGYSLEPQLTATINKVTAEKRSSNLSIGLSLNSQEGVALNASYGLSHEMEKNRAVSLGLSGTYSSRHGVQGLAITGSAEEIGKKEVVVTDKAGNPVTNENGEPVKITIKETLSAGSYSMNLDFGVPSYTPAISYPMYTKSYALKFKLGPAYSGVYPYGSIQGFYTKQELKNNGAEVPWEGYGYLNYEQGALNKHALSDLNREKDGMVSEETPNLGLPSYTYDVYSASGQGMGAMYRPFRSDFGIVADPVKESGSHSLSLGVDVGIPSHIGVNASLFLADSWSGQWVPKSFSGRENFEFRGKSLDNPLYEPSYFKVHGELTSVSANKLQAIGGEKAVKFNLHGVNEISSPIAPQAYLNERVSRNQVVQPLRVEQLLDGQNKELYPLFSLQYYHGTETTTLRPYQRTNLQSNGKKHHIAGFTALNPDGLQYTYALPAYNLTQKEATFSVNDGGVNIRSRVDIQEDGNSGSAKHKHNRTDQFLHENTTPAYPHAFLLTSVTGPDYVDVTGNGITDDDLGYWIKFTYRKLVTDGGREYYRWRSPYDRANFDEGYRSSDEDDRGSYVYGEKEMWLLARVESKSHYAEFSVSKREDGLEAAGEFATLGAKGSFASYKLDKIALYSKQQDKQPIKQVRFRYAETAEDELCRGIENAANGRGKLTLKQLWFEYGNNSRGKLNPYTFDYHVSNPIENPNYNMYAVDRWGNYKPVPKNASNEEDVLSNYDFPYIDQTTEKETLDAYAGSWSLKEIRLPSGGKIVVDYEMDDYAYVQNRKAMQMMKVVGLEEVGRFDNYLPMGGPAHVDFNKVIFELEQPIPAEKVGSGAGQQTAQEVVLRYLDENGNGVLDQGRERQLYFKFLLRLRSKGGKVFDDFIKGYVDLNPNPASMGLEPAVNGEYRYGYFEMKEDRGYQAIAYRAWQHLKVNQPELATPIARSGVNPDGLKGQIEALIGMVKEVDQMFTGYYNYAQEKGWAKQVIQDKAWVRLYTPDKIKKGGGHRVKQLTLFDNWARQENLSSEQKGEREGVYGQVYDYTLEENGEQISSGVATNEPILGGEENTLRYGKKYTQSVFLASNNNLYFEYPVNAAYYPGASVGYRKVTVKSLASGWLENREMKYFDDWFSKTPDKSKLKFGSSGQTEHEFYTAKDFPVLAYETDKKDKPKKHKINLGLYKDEESKLTSSQGYSIVLNDMHGKPKATRHYAQGEDGQMAQSPFSKVEYKYFNKKMRHEGKTVQALDNLFAYQEQEDGQGYLQKTNKVTSNSRYLGLEQEVMIDMRRNVDGVYNGGTDTNVDFIFAIFLPIPIPSWWPNLGKSFSALNTTVINKVIHKSGVLQEIVAEHEGSRVTTQNLCWDAQTGRAILTKVNNNFDQPIYSHQIPAFWKYEGMGPAYKNIGLEFDAKLNVYQPNAPSFKVKGGTWDQVSSQLSPGDKVMVFTTSGNNQAITGMRYKGFGIFTKDLGRGNVAEDTDYRFRLNRTGLEFTAQCTPYVLKALAYEASEGNWMKAKPFLMPWDELLVYPKDENGNIKPAQARMVYVGDGIFAQDEGRISGGNEYHFYIYRSGRRNQLNADAGGITALKNPMEPEAGQQ